MTWRGTGSARALEDGLGGGAIGVPLLGHDRWVRDLRARSPLGPTRRRSPGAAEGRSHLGLDRRVLRGSGWQSPHPAGCGSPCTTTRSSRCSWSLRLSRTGKQSTTSCSRKWLDRAWRWLEITPRESFLSGSGAGFRLAQGCPTTDEGRIARPEAVPGRGHTDRC